MPQSRSSRRFKDSNGDIQASCGIPLESLQIALNHNKTDNLPPIEETQLIRRISMSNMA